MLRLFHSGYASFKVDQIVTPIDIGYDVVEHHESTTRRVRQRRRVRFCVLIGS